MWRSRSITVVMVTCLLITGDWRVHAEDPLLATVCERNSGAWVWDLEVECPGNTTIWVLPTTVFWGREANETSSDSQCTGAAGADQPCDPTVTQKAEVSAKISAICDGNKSCKIAPTTDFLGDPCAGSYKYLKFYYLCQASCPEGKVGAQCEKDAKCLAVDRADRRNCGHKGINQAACQQKGCCWNNSKPKTVWCFYGFQDGYATPPTLDVMTFNNAGCVKGSLMPDQRTPCCADFTVKGEWKCRAKGCCYDVREGYMACYLPDTAT